MSARTELRVALATCAEFPDLDEDGPAVLAGLAARGMRAEPAVWDDEAVAWDAYSLVVVRSTWDYSDRRDEFLAWAGRVPRLLNSPEVLRWNTDKRYLGELAAAGVPTVATTYVEPGGDWEPPPARFVVKPSVSAGSRNTASYAGGDPSAGEHVRRLLAACRTVMVQPYVTDVDDHGETALLYLGGEFSHAVRKDALLTRGEAPMHDELFLEEQIEPQQPDAAQRQVAERALAAVPFGADEILYARVDLLPGADGPVLLELELTEPSLFLEHGEGSSERFADAIVSAALRAQSDRLESV